MTNIPDLIKRLEAAEGPSRELDVLIGAVVDVDCRLPLGMTLAGYVGAFGVDRAAMAAEAHNSLLRTTLPRYTASVDDALTLVPDGWHVVDMCTPNPTMLSQMALAVVGPNEFGDEDEERPVGAHLTSLPIALTTACLKARLDALPQ